MVRDLRDELFDNLQVQSLSFFGRSDVGKLISSCTNNINVVEAVISSTVSDLVRAPFEIIAALVFVVILSVKAEMLSFVLFMSLVFPMCVVPIVILGRYVKRHTVRALERVSDLVSRMHENFTGIRVVKAFYMEKKEAERFRIMNGRYFRSIIKALRAELMMTPLMEAVALIMGAIFIIVCYSRNIRLHELIPIGGAAVWVYHPLKKLAKVNASMQRGAAALQSIYSLLDEKDVLEEKASPVVIKDFTDRVTFEGVGFRYVKSSPLVLENISFQIPKGSVVAVVGETGSGKTTLANLLARFYDPSEGRVLIDGIDLKDVEIASLRKLIGVVTQETVLFNDTIASNISYGMDNVPEEKIIDAAKRANAHDFIISDPEGYQRVVGEKGFVLSGGERQRIAIARAVLRNSPILILDEATSSLDTVTERLVQQAIAEVMKDRTVFAIAHRLSTVKHADQIMLIADGGIAERGSHEELYSMNGRYRKLCDMQVLDN